ncbi:MAG: aspartyl protease family protein [Candidatus Binatia bacterium]
MKKGKGVMGLTHKHLIVKERQSAKRAVEVAFLVDSGAMYSVVPTALLKKIGVKPYKTVEFTLADGRKLKRKVGDAYFELNGTGGAAPVIFGERDDEPLLGATTLESLGLALDPFRRELYPARMMLA